MPKYVCLEGLEQHNRFYSTYTEEKDPTKLQDGTVVYKVLGYADTDVEARKILYGPNCDDPLEVALRIREYITTLEVLHASHDHRHEA